MKIIFATWLTDRTLGTSLTKKGGSQRLVSYHFLLEQKITRKHLIKYVETGNADVRKTKKAKK